MQRILSCVLFGLLLACSTTKGTDRPVVSVNAQPNASGVQRVEIAMHSYYFEPNRIVVKKAAPVELVLSNSDHVVPHNFSLHEGGLHVDEDKWGFGNDTVHFTPMESGEFHFYCNKGDHAGEGMVGTLVVVD